MAKSIVLNQLNLSFPNKVCFEDFSAQVLAMSRIAIVGDNGCGKSSLLSMIEKQAHAQNISIGYVPQMIELDQLSGAERFHKALSGALQHSPDVLLLDEPTNHLDKSNRKALLRMLKNYAGTLIIATHDLQLINSIAEIIWHIKDGKVTQFVGCYDDYLQAIAQAHQRLKKQSQLLNKQKKQDHQNLMQEQKRASKSRDKGQKSIHNRKWPTIVSKAKVNRATQTSGLKRAQINKQAAQTKAQLADLKLPEVVTPSFSFTSGDTRGPTILSIREGAAGYGEQQVVRDIKLSLLAKERMVIRGDNASGKSTLVKAMMGHASVSRIGDWFGPEPNDIGYLDQHYGSLNESQTVLEHLEQSLPGQQTLVRRLLSDFLFKSDDSVNTKVKYLSGGEKARLSLALIAAKTPKLLILDEVTNNLDRQAQAHIIQSLVDYPGALIVISHDEAFVEAIKVEVEYDLNQQR